MVRGLVSIMMPVFNGGRYIRSAIESALAQHYPTWELVIVDDGSTDDSATIATAVADSRIRVVRQRNRGESSARNVALDAMRGEYVAFLDADDRYLPDHLSRVIERFQSRPETAGVFTDGFHVTEDERRLGTLSSRRQPAKQGRVFDEVVFGSDFFGPPVCVVLRRDVIESHALRFDETIVMGPDWDFFVRYAALGAFQYVPETTCEYRVHRHSITTSLDVAARRRERAKCRTRAIKLPAFGACPVAVRFNAFYDLLVVSLRGEPAEQEEAIAWPEFQALPGSERSRLLRLVADEGIVLGYESSLVSHWLREARRAAPGDLKTRLVAACFAVHPEMCGALLRARRVGRQHTIDLPPFADLGIE